MNTKILSPLRRDGYKAGMIMMLIALSTMLLTTACSNEDDALNNTANTENTINKGYALPVTVNVTRQGDEGTTRASYNESTRKLEFSDGDKLFVEGLDNGGAGSFAGTLNYVSGGTFSGTIYTQNKWPSTADDLFTAASADGFVNATLLPAGYESYDYLEIIDEGYEALLGENAYNSFATSKKLGVEQLSFEHGEYTSGTGFVLEPRNAILNFTITGLTASTKVTAALSDDEDWTPDIEGEVTTDGSGNATFAIGLEDGSDLNEFSLTVAGNPVTLVTESKTLTAGKIYNITRAVTPPTLAQTMTNAGMTVKVKYNYANVVNYCLFSSVGDGTYTFQSGYGWAGGDANCAKALVVEGGKLVFKQNFWDTIEEDWSSRGFSVTFDTSNDTYIQWVGSWAQGVHNPSFISVEVNSVDITSTLTAVPSETITLTGGSDRDENTYSGTHFQVTGSGDDTRVTVNKWGNMVISAKTGKTIVDVVFSYAVDDMNLDALTFSSGTFDGSNMVENVNATSLTVGSTSPAGTPFNGVTIYYSE